MPNFVALNVNEHKNHKFKRHLDLKHTSEMHMTPICVQEFSAVCHEYPILFVKDSETGQFRAVALLGIKPKENVYYKEGDWNADYLPEYLRQYPFVLTIDPNNKDQGMLCFDADSESVNEAEGEALFNEDGSQSDFTRNIGEFIATYNAKMQSTVNFCKELVDKNLLVSKNLELQLANEEKYNLTGLYIIDEEKIQELSDEDYLSLRKNNLLAAIYAQLLSLSRINKLLKLHNKKLAE